MDVEALPQNELDTEKVGDTEAHDVTLGEKEAELEGELVILGLMETEADSLSLASEVDVRDIVGEAVADEQVVTVA